jgi:calcineurin-like phosphoesterase family protein
MKIKLNSSQKLWFTSDTHYDHKNICTATTNWVGAENLTRKFSSLDQMNDELVTSINSKVGQDDILFHLGDWSFNGFENIRKFRERIVCKNVHLILGNHDHHIERNKDNIQSIFSSVNEYLSLDVKWELNQTQMMLKSPNSARFVLFHYPIASWNGMSDGVIHLHGHVHLSPQQRVANGKAMDVGVDGNNMEPISMEEVLKIMSKQPIAKLTLPKDHHEKRV